MTEKAIWLTVESPLSQDEVEHIRRVLEQTELSERYEFIITDDRIDTLDMDELQLLIDDG